MDDWPVDRDLDEKLRRTVNEEVAAADPRQIRPRPVVGAGRPWVRTGLALAAVVALIAVLGWRAQPAPPYMGESDSPSAVPSATASEPSSPPPSLALAPSLTPSPMLTRVPELAPGPTANPAVKPTRTLRCPWADGVIVPLADGRLLVAAGGACPSAAIFDPARRTFQSTGASTSQRVLGTATLLRDGRVLIAGGLGSDSGTSATMTTDEIYDPATGRFTPIGPVPPHGSAASALLQDGRVLIVGSDLDATGRATAEVYDPTTGTLRAAGPLAAGIAVPAALPLDDGTVLVVHEFQGGPILTQLYDPTTNSFRATRGQLEGELACAARLPNGRVMVFNESTSEAYDPTTETFSRLANPSHVRSVMACTTLTDGRILAIGAANDVPGPPTGSRSQKGMLMDRGSVPTPGASSENSTTAYTLAAIAFDPATNAWTYLGHLNREYLAGIGVASLPNGGAMLIGNEPGGSGHGTTELFDPKLVQFTVNE